MNKHFIELGIVEKVNYNKLFNSSVFSVNSLLLSSVLQCFPLQFLPVTLSALLDS